MRGGVEVGLVLRLVFDLAWCWLAVVVDGRGRAPFAFGPSDAAHKRSQFPGTKKSPSRDLGWFLDGLFSVHAFLMGTRPDWIPGELLGFRGGRAAGQLELPLR